MNLSANSKKESGKQSALEDWNNQRVYKLFAGSIYSKVPSIDEGGFYVAMSAEGREYVDSYNTTIKDMVSKNGLPAWAPGVRTLDEKRLDEFFAEATKNLEIDLSTKEERNLIRKHILALGDRYDKKPDAHIYFPNKRVILFLTKMEDGVIYGDTVDLHYGSWMQSFSK
ncbi:MAG: hypothetical protein AB2803_03795 [Candidatus Thiodiazotropha sp.]|jgi:hypothetical protein